MASTLIGALRVSLGLDSAQFSRGLQDAQGSMARLGGQMQKIGAAVSVVGAGIGLAIRGQLNAADDLAKLGQKIGIPVEALSQLEHAANLSGVGLEQLRTGFTIFSRNLSEQAGKFEAVGIATRDAAGKMRPTVDVVADLADVLAGMPDGAEKTALAVSLLGESGAHMIPLLNGGSAALREMMAEADRLGLTITDKTAKAAEAFNDNLTRLRASVVGLARQITAALAPVLAALTESVAGIAETFARLPEGLQTVAAALAGVAVAAGPLLFALGSIVKMAVPLAAMAAAAAGPWALLAGAVVAAGAAFALFRDNTKTGKEPIEDARVALELLNEALGTFNLSSPEAAGNSITQAQAHARNAEAAIKAAEAELELMRVRIAAMTFPGAPNDSNPALEKQKREAEAQKEIIASLTRSLEEARRRMKANVVEITGMGDAWNGTTETITTATLALDGFGGAADDMEERVRRAMQKINEDLEETKTLAEDLKPSFASAFESIVTGSQPARTALAQLASAVSSLFARKAFESIWGGLKLGNVFGNLSSFDGGGFTGMGARSGGIDGKGGFPAILHPNETVVDHTRGPAAGGVTVINNIDARGAVAGVGEQIGLEFDRRMPQVAAVARGAVADALSRGRRG